MCFDINLIYKFEKEYKNLNLNYKNMLFFETKMYKFFCNSFVRGTAFIGCGESTNWFPASILFEQLSAIIFVNPQSGVLVSDVK